MGSPRQGANERFSAQREDVSGIFAVADHDGCGSEVPRVGKHKGLERTGAVDAKVARSNLPPGRLQNFGA